MSFSRLREGDAVSVHSAVREGARSGAADFAPKLCRLDVPLHAWVRDLFSSSISEGPF